MLQGGCTGFGSFIGLGTVSGDTFFFFQISFRRCRKKKSFLALRFMSPITRSEVTHLRFCGADLP